MKHLYLIRHAKSSWTDSSLKDFDRILNERGERDAPKMAKHFKKKVSSPDLFISSSAKRAMKTCKIFASEFNYNLSDIIYKDELYLAPPNLIFDLILNIDDKYKSVALFGHNPGITDLANALIENISIDNVPTCGVFAITADCKSWKDLGSCNRTFLFFDYPRII